MSGLSHQNVRALLNSHIRQLSCLAILMGLLLLSMPTLASSLVDNGKSSPTTILVVGDSLSSEYGIKRGTGWVQLLRNRLKGTRQETTEVINASISGDTTSGGLTRLPKLLEQHRPSVVVLELGGNDALRGLSLQMTQDNLSKMTEFAQKSGATVILVGMQIPENYGPVYTEAFRKLYPDLAQRKGALLVPFLLAGLETDRSMFIEDGIHPSSQAQPKLLDNMWPAIEQALSSSLKSQSNGR